MTYHLETIEETKARLIAEMAVKKAAEKTRTDIESYGFLPFGRKSYDGETTVWVNDASTFEQEVSSVQDGIQFARMIDDNHGKAMVKQYETAIDATTGEETFITIDKSFGAFNLPCKRFVYTDSKGIIIPMAEAHNRMGLGLHVYTHSASACVSDEEYTGEYTQAGLCELVYRPGFGERQDNSRSYESVWITPEVDILEKESESLDRRWIFEASPSCSLLNFNRLMLSRDERPCVDVVKISATAIAVDRERLKKMWAQVAAIAASRKECVETEIPLPESTGYKPLGSSPVKVMTRKDRLAATKRRYRGWKNTPVCPKKLAAKKDCEQTIEMAQQKLAKINAELETFVSGQLVYVPFRKKEVRIERSEILIEGLQVMARHQRKIIREERGEIKHLGV